ncbi:hypothetical protein V6N12_040814 [Hibiscus sabdariffa]|uniref:Uncharacterized protein n=1 Tax=Hibiscus sabdariffa TaxID=183260 RepID=A0ABR2E6B1_9ROSI
MVVQANLAVSQGATSQAYSGVSSANSSSFDHKSMSVVSQGQETCGQAYTRESRGEAPAQVYNHVFQPVPQQMSVQQQTHGFSQYGHGHSFPHHQQFSYFPAQGVNSLPGGMPGFFSPVVPISTTLGGYNNFPSSGGSGVTPSALVSSSGGVVSQGTPSAAQASISFSPASQSTTGFGPNSSTNMNVLPDDTVWVSTSVPVVQTVTSLNDLLVESQYSVPNAHVSPQQRCVSVEVPHLSEGDRVVCVDSSQSVQVPSQEETMCVSRRIGVENAQSSGFGRGSGGQSGLATGCYEDGSLVAPVVSEAGRALSSETHESFNEVSEASHGLPTETNEVFTDQVLPAETNESLNEGVEGGATSEDFHRNDSVVEPAAEVVSGQIPCSTGSTVAVNKTINSHPMVTRGKSGIRRPKVYQAEVSGGSEPKTIQEAFQDEN